MQNIINLVLITITKTKKEALNLFNSIYITIVISLYLVYLRPYSRLSNLYFAKPFSVRI